MVALLHSTHPTDSDRRASSDAVARAASVRPRHLRLVETQAGSAPDPLSIVAVVAVVATLMLVVLVRGVQGTPPASDWQSLTESAAPGNSVSAPLEALATVTVAEGDSWNTISARVAPGVDPVEFARTIASANGGYQLHVGQVLVIPAVG